MSAALKKLGDRLREARLAAGISQAQLGAPYFTRAHVSAIELGKIRPAMRSLEHLARKLGKPASYFLDDAESERSRKERELEIGSVAGLLTFAGAPEALRRAERLLDADELSVRETCRLRLYAGSALNLLHRGRDATAALAGAQRLAGELQDIKVVMYTLDSEVCEAARHLGAAGCVLKDAQYEVLLRAIRNAYASMRKSAETY